MSKTLEEKQNYAKQYIRSLKAIEDEMEVYKEQKRDLRDEYREQGWGFSTRCVGKTFKLIGSLK